jgi:hypothetical protein
MSKMMIGLNQFSSSDRGLINQNNLKKKRSRVSFSIKKNIGSTIFLLVSLP